MKYCSTDNVVVSDPDVVSLVLIGLSGGEVFKTYHEMCETIVKRNGFILSHIRKEYQTIKMQLAAVRQKGESIRYCNKAPMEVQKAAISNSLQAYYWIHDPSTEIRKFRDKILQKISLRTIEQAQKLEKRRQKR